MGRGLPQHFPHSAIEPERQGQVDPQQHPMTPPLPAVAIVTDVPSPPMSRVAYDPQPQYTGPAITTRNDEDARGSEFLGPGAPSAFPSAEEWAQLENDLDIIIQGGQTWLAHAFLSATYMFSDP
jgi:hypothetical protein